MTDLYGQIQAKVKEVSNILIVSHRKPDADTLGSAVALKIWIDSLGRASTLACIDKPSSSFSYLPFVDLFVMDFELSSFDLIIIPDSGASYMTNFHIKYPNFFTSGIPIVNIDHHASNDLFGDINLVDSDAPSVTTILYRFFKCIGFEIDEGMATALLGGIYGDTGGFMHSNTSAEVFEIASDLLAKGARIAEITSCLFGSNQVSTLRLWGKVLENARITGENVVMSVVKDDDYVAAGATPEQLSGVIDYLNMIPDSKFAVLINEDRNGNVKGSFRTRQANVDLSRIAAVFGGGGHSKASGFSVPGKLEYDVHYKIVSDDLSKKTLDF